MRLTHTIVPGLLASTMLVGSASGAFAAKAHRTPRHHARAHLVLDAGRVSNLSATGFTLTWAPRKTTVTPKTYEITLATTTKQTAAKNTTGALMNGEYAIVLGAKTTTAITARDVRYSTKPFAARMVRIMRARLRLRQLTAPRIHALRGAVATTSATQLAVTTKAGKTITFALTATTKYRVNKVLQTSAPAFTAGEKVAVFFKRDKATKALDALSIVVRTA